MYLPIHKNKKTLKLRGLIRSNTKSLKETDIVLGSTEPANYTSSYIVASKEIAVDTEIVIY